MRVALCLGLVTSAAACGRIGFGPEPEPGDDDSATYRDAVLADRPLSYWRLGDTDQVARDEMGRADGAYGGTCEHAATGALARDDNTAARFDGMSCHVALPDVFAFPGKAPFSVEAWVSFAAVGSYQHFFMSERRDASDPIDGYALLLGPGGIYFERVKNRNNTATAGFVVQPGMFLHVVGVYDGSSVMTYVDGTQVASRKDTGTMATFAAHAIIGASSAGIGFMNGILDEVAIYDHALSAARIALHHTIGTTGDP